MGSEFTVALVAAFVPVAVTLFSKRARPGLAAWAFPGAVESVNEFG